MTQPSPSTLPDTSAFPKVIGSTAQILVTLYKNQLKLKSVDTGNPLIDRAVALDMQTVEIKKNLSTSSTTRLGQTAEAISVSLGQLRGFSQETKAYAIAQDISLQELKGKASELGTKREELAKQYTVLVDEQLKVLGKFLTSENPSEAEISNTINDLEKKRKNLADEVGQYTKQHQDIENRLNSLYAQVYPQVPDKSNIPVPVTQETASTGFKR